MSGRWSVGSIAGVAIQTGSRACRIDVVDGEGFRNTVVSTSRQALDYSVHTQSGVRGSKFIKFKVRVEFIEIGNLNAIIAALEAAMVAVSSGVSVILSDAGSAPKVDNFSATCLPDTESIGGKYFTRGALSNGFVKDVTFPFTTVS